MHLHNVIIQLLLSDLVWPKVITISGAHCTMITIESCFLSTLTCRRPNACSRRTRLRRKRCFCSKVVRRRLLIRRRSSTLRRFSNCFSNCFSMSRFLSASVRRVSAVEPFFCRLRRGGEEGFLKKIRMKIKYLPFTRLKAHFI
jgi:hypothetical protein